MKDTNDLNPENAKVFHILVAHFLYIYKRFMPDLASVVLFLTTRVYKPREDDVKKLGIVK